MAVNYAAALKSARMQAVIDAIDAGCKPGYIEICTAAYAAVLSTIMLPKPSFIEADGVITMAGVPLSDDSAANAGTAAVARIKDSDGNVIVNRPDRGRRHWRHAD